MIITNVNVNGIRAAVKHRSETNLGFLPWLSDTAPDYVLLQETRASHDQVTEALAPALEQGWHLSLAEAEKKGHAGVAVLSRTAPDAVRIGFGSNEFDHTGRYLEADFGDLTVASLYLPKGASDGEKRDEKFRFMDEFGAHITALARKRRDVAIGGDWNIAPNEVDLKAWKTNKRSPGFLPEERAWVADLTSNGLRDVHRELHGDEPGPYSWWSWRGKAFDNDSGWRIDYQLANKRLAARAQSAQVHRADAYDLRWSDHAPVAVTYAD
ncbi:exodeoxyribonuclease III [Jongsikchunia kroppenstedtii]|uniref:exodeoxyribonuclease III n=1 Tax=Jongsikchunia kroppenstedtii TaxID=1121721 RepID=UPI0003782E24|nr:exodeoxyribonuclease III [Jongsikchunia kroppenstedtii]